MLGVVSGYILVSVKKMYCNDSRGKIHTRSDDRAKNPAELTELKAFTKTYESDERFERDLRIDDFYQRKRKAI